METNFNTLNRFGSAFLSCIYNLILYIPFDLICIYLLTCIYLLILYIHFIKRKYILFLQLRICFHLLRLFKTIWIIRLHSVQRVTTFDDHFLMIWMLTISLKARRYEQWRWGPAIYFGAWEISKNKYNLNEWSVFQFSTWCWWKTWN